jgi:hypothetical protein
MINHKEYPLVFLQSIQSLFSKIRIVVEANSDIAAILIDHDFEIKIKDHDSCSIFNFRVSDPDFEKGKVVFLLEYYPINHTELKPYKGKVFADQVVRHLNGWIELIKQYNNINISPEDKILRSYEDEFYTNFELVDEDANEKPFDLGRQLMLDVFMRDTIKTLRAADVVNEELVQEAENIRGDISKLTKQATVKRMSRFFALVRKEGIELLKSLYVGAKSELIKLALNGGVDTVKGFFES